MPINSKRCWYSCSQNNQRTSVTSNPVHCTVSTKRTKRERAETVVAKPNKPTSVTSYPVQYYPRCLQSARGAEAVVAKPNKQHHWRHILCSTLSTMPITSERCWDSCSQTKQTTSVTSYPVHVYRHREVLDVFIAKPNFSVETKPNRRRPVT